MSKDIKLAIQCTVIFLIAYLIVVGLWFLFDPATVKAVLL
jgi:hypothetical protein